MVNTVKFFIVRHLGLIVVLLLTTVILCFNLDKPFWGHHDWNGAYWGNVARNYVKYGLATKFAMVENIGLVKPSDFAYNFHYLPLYPQILSIFFVLFGIHEWVSRLMSVVFSLATLVIFYKIVLTYFNKRLAIIAVTLWSLNPMFLYFAKMPVHEPMVMFFIVLFWFSVLVKRERLALMSLTLAELTTWTGFFVVPVISIYWFWNKKNVSLRQVVKYWVISFVVFGFLIIHNFIVTGNPIGGGLSQIFLERVSYIPISEFVPRLIRWGWSYYTFLLPLSFVWVVSIFFKKHRHVYIPLLLLGSALIYPIIFRDASFRHDYLLIYFLPFLSLSAALFLSQVSKNNIVVQCLLVALMISATIYLRLPFFLALANSDIYRDSVNLGKYINLHSAKTENVVVLNENKNAIIDGWYVAFYADRRFTILNSPVKLNNQSKNFRLTEKGIVEIE